jgi:hypothetical protein
VRLLCKPHLARKSLICYTSQPAAVYQVLRLGCCLFARKSLICYTSQPAAVYQVLRLGCCLFARKSLICYTSQPVFATKAGL